MTSCPNVKSRQRLKSDGFLILHDLSQYGSYRPSRWICFWIPTLVSNNTFIISFQYFPYERAWWFKWECIPLAKILEHLVFNWWHCLEMFVTGEEIWKLMALPFSYLTSSALCCGWDVSPASCSCWRRLTAVSSELTECAQASRAV